MREYRFSLTRILLYKDRIVDSVLIQENTGQWKTVFSLILCSVRSCILLNADVKLKEHVSLLSIHTSGNFNEKKQNILTGCNSSTFSYKATARLEVPLIQISPKNPDPIFFHITKMQWIKKLSHYLFKPFSECAVCSKCPKMSESLGIKGSGLDDIFETLQNVKK